MDTNGSLLMLQAELYSRVLALQSENAELRRVLKQAEEKLEAKPAKANRSKST